MRGLIVGSLMRKTEKTNEQEIIAAESASTSHTHAADTKWIRRVVKQFALLITPSPSHFRDQKFSQTNQFIFSSVCFNVCNLALCSRIAFLLRRWQSTHMTTLDYWLTSVVVSLPRYIRHCCGRPQCFGIRHGQSNLSSFNCKSKTIIGNNAFTILSAHVSIC